MLDLLRERLPALGRMVWARIVLVWQRDRLFLLTLLALDIFFARRTFGGGIWADNDSVCHYAYLRHLLEDIYPQTGTFLAYSPRFDMGVPFLLYNTPPGTYVLSGIVATVLHVSALAGLKITVMGGFLSVPILGYLIAKTFDDSPPDAPKYVALTLAVFSSELWGLEFFFKNGMLNPALGVPFLLATLYFFRRAQTSVLPVALRHIAFAGFFFACTVCTHLLSAYMLGLALGAFVLGRPLKDWGLDVIRLGASLALGGGLAAFWLVPSAPFAATEDAAYTWLRRPIDTVSSFFDGSLLSSYFGGFFPSFITISNVGVVAVALGFIAIAIGIFRNRETGPRVAFIVFALGFWIMLGPTWSLIIKWLPGYDRLLWYRFVTLAELGWFMLAGFGAAHVAGLDKRFTPYNKLALVAGFGWAIVVMAGRAPKVETANKYPEFLADLDQVVSWLKENGDRRGRVYDEFLGQGVIQPPSVNYPRHMTPILSGFDEVSGWIYENNLSSQVLMKKGAFWNSPFPMIEEAPRYNVKYVVAGSPHFVRALELDPRWHHVVGERNLVLYENRAYDPTLAEGNRLRAKAWTQHYLRGGGYQYDLELVDQPGSVSDDASPFVVKVGYLPYFKVYADDKEVLTKASVDGLLQADVPQGTKRLRCVWDVTPLRERGNKISYGALVVGLLLVGASYVKRLSELAKLRRPFAIAGLAAGGLGVIGVLIRDRNVDLSPVGWGVRDGITPFLNPEKLPIGYYDDDRPTAIVHVLAPAWGVRTTEGRFTARKLDHPEQPAFEVALAPGRPATILLRGEQESVPVHLTLSAPSGTVTCEVDSRTHVKTVLPKECATPTEVESRGELPGITRKVALKSDAEIVLTHVTVSSGIQVVEVESLKNSFQDSGFEAFYSFGTIETRPSNGVMMLADVKLDLPVDLVGHPSIMPGKTEVWLLHRTFHQRFFNTRAEVSVWIDDKKVGGSRGESRWPRQFWERDAVFEWIDLGAADVGPNAAVKVQLAKVEDTVAGLAEIDSLAFVPRD